MKPDQPELAAAYLSTSDALMQSGFSGGRARWERLRRPVAAAVDRSGSLLDIGCANGALLEDLASWCGERSLKVEPYGLDVSPDLVALARERRPQWSDRLYVGDALTWNPPRRWDWVRTELLYANEADVPALLARLLTLFVTAAGHLLVCQYASRRDEMSSETALAVQLSYLGFTPERVLQGIDLDGVVRTQVAVLRRPLAHPRRRPPISTGLEATDIRCDDGMALGKTQE